LDDLLIRAGQQRDISEVLRLWQTAGSPPTVSDTHRGLSQLLLSHPGGLLIAVRGPSIIGSLIAVFDGWRASFYRLSVHPDHRRQRVASELLAEGERRVAELGAMRLTAIVADDDPRASGFWKAAGYEAQSQRARFVKLTNSA
jgi:ribosomal protein S18 acetylase RimI-like enzyme